MDGNNGNLTTNAPPPFLSKTYDMVDDPSTNSIVSWSAGNNSFVVWNPPEFARDLLPKYFKHNNFSSFVRQLNTYGFKKVDPDRWEFANDGFLRGQKHLLKSINRRKPSHVPSHQQLPQQQSSFGACVEVGKFGLEEEVERLKRDKNVLMQELVRLRQQQQGTDHELHTMGQRLQGMEQRQQQMMSFLAKAMQSPGFLAQLVQQQNESNRLIAGVGKKRRFPKQEENPKGEHPASPDGQIVKYQPLMNEAAKAMLRQILKIDASPRLEPANINPDSFLIDNIPSLSDALESGNSPTRSSGLRLSEVPPLSSQSYLPVSSSFPVIRPPAAMPEIQSSPNIVTDMISTVQFPDMNMLQEGSIDPCHDDMVMSDFSQIQGIVPESSAVDIPNANYEGPEAGNGCDTDSISVGVDGSTGIQSDMFSSDPYMDISFDEIPKLPGINDVFWEQFLTDSPLSGDRDEIDTMSQSHDEVTKEVKPGQENGWDKARHLDQLTEQMGLLTSETNGG